MQVTPYEAIKPFFERIGYAPYPEQEAVHRALLEENGDLPRTVVVGGGMQAGKSFLAHHAFGRWLQDPLVWLVGARHEDCKREYEYIRDAAVKANLTQPGMYSMAKEGPWELTYVNGHKVKTLDSEDPTKLAREAPDGIIFCEPGRQTAEAFNNAWDRLVPRGGWFLIAGTFEEEHSPWYADLALQAQGENPWGAVFYRLASWSNLANYPRGFNDPKIQGALRTAMARDPQNGREVFDERYGGMPRKSKGVVFSEFRRAVHVARGAEFDETREVYLAVDPGYDPSAYAVLWCQIAGEQILVFDEIYVNQMVHSEVLTLVRNHRAFPQVRHVVMDVSGSYHAGASESAYEAWMGGFAGDQVKPTISGQRVEVLTRNGRIHDKLRVNPLTGKPYLMFSPRCVNTIYEFEKGYRKHVHKISGLVTSDKPIDRENHAIAAIGYLIVDRYALADLPPLPTLLPVTVRHRYDRVFSSLRGR